VETPAGKRISLPACEEYASIAAGLKAKWGEAEVSADIRNSLDRVQRHFAMQAKDLCENAPIYLESGEQGQYFCRNEKLTDSVIDLAQIDAFLGVIDKIEDPKEKSGRIQQLIADYYKRDSRSCFPQTSLPSEAEALHKKVNDLYMRIVSLIADYYKRSAAHKPYDQGEIFQLESQVRLLRSEFSIYEGRLSVLENRAPRDFAPDFVMRPGPITNLRLR
jgi:hypothetical protein